MKSVKDLKIEDLNLSRPSRELLDKLSLDEVVLLVRQKDFPPYYDKQKSIDYNRNFWIYRNREIANDFARLDFEMCDELARLDMLRDDFYESERFRISANIRALVRDIAESYRKPVPEDSECNDYVQRLIRKLDNERYETWQGFSYENIDTVKTLLKTHMTTRQYNVICARYGLGDGKCRTWQEVADHLGWKSEKTAKRYAKRAFRRALKTVNDLRAVTRITS